MWVTPCFMPRVTVAKKAAIQQHRRDAEWVPGWPPTLLTSPLPPSLVCLGHFHSVCSPTPSPFVHATQRRHPIGRDSESLARRLFGNELGGEDGGGGRGAQRVSDSIEMHRGSSAWLRLGCETQPPRPSGTEASTHHLEPQCCTDVLIKVEPM